MQTLSQNLISIEWWLGVVIVGILLNILSAYLKPLIDRAFAKVSSSWDVRTKRKLQERVTLVQHLRNNPQEQLHLVAEEMRCRLRAIFDLVAAIGVAILAFLAPPTWAAIAAFWISLLAMFFALTEHLAAMRYLALLDDARVSHIERDGL
jgi:hypothetical protein